MAQSGNRPPRRGQPTNGGNRTVGNGKPAPGNEPDGAAAERARERLAQRNASGQKRQGAAQRARAASPAAPKAKTQTPPAQRSRPSGPNSRRGSSKKPQQRSTAMTLAVLGTVLVVLIILVIVLVGVTAGKPKPGSAYGMTIAPASVVNAVSGVSPSAFTAAGSTASSSSGPYTSALIMPKKQPALTSGGKPLVVYVGSNFCPYCAATRWPLTIALARFGTFKGLHMTSSGPSPEPYPDTNTLSYYHATYKSPYVSFLATEQCTDIPSTLTTKAVEECNGYVPLEPLTGTAYKVFAKYDFGPFQTESAAGGIPFVDFGNKVIEDGAFIDPTILAGYSHIAIAQSLSANPTAAPANTILVAANYYTAEICNLTGGKPGSVCKMAVVKQAATALKS